MSMLRSSPMRALTGLVLALSLAACSSDTGSNSDPFDAEGTTEAMDALSAPFDAPIVQSFNALGDDMDNTFPSSLVRASVALVGDAARGRGITGKAGSIAGVVRALPSARNGVAFAVLPPEVLGLTYEYDTASDGYVASARTGAPPNGVRFIVYATNPASGAPVEPLQEVGYADLRDEGTGSTESLNLQLVSDATTYLDYTITASQGATDATVGIAGFATDGTTRTNFDLANVASSGGDELRAFYQLDVPSRGISLDYLINMTDALADSEVNVTLAGPDGSVAITGMLDDGTGALATQVNSSTFAIINVVGNDVTAVTNPDGGALTAQEQGAVLAIWSMVLRGFDIFEDLLDPVVTHI